MGDHAGILGAVVSFFSFFLPHRSSHQWLKHHCLLLRKGSMKNVSHTYIVGRTSTPPRWVMSPFVHLQIPSFTTTVHGKNSIHYQRLFTLYTPSIVYYIEGYERGDSDWVEIHGANRCRAVSRGKMGRATEENRGTSSIRSRWTTSGGAMVTFTRLPSSIYVPSVTMIRGMQNVPA